MRTFTADTIVTDVNNLYGGTVATGVQLININAALRQLLIDAPSARFSSPIAFTDEITVAGLTNTDTVAVDIRWKQALVYFATALAFGLADRSSVNIERQGYYMKKYLEAL